MPEADTIATRPTNRTDEPEPVSPWPPVSVVMPVRDEAHHLGASVAAVLDQDYPGPMDVVLAVGPSRDGTERLAARIAAADPRVHLIDNPKGLTAAGLNLAIGASRGTVVARVDGHAILPPGYLRRAVELLAETGAANVGGVMAAEGHEPFQQAVAAAMSSRFGVGNARFHYGGPPGPVDTVYLGVFVRSALEAAGGFDETLVRAQDAELNHRLRDRGGLVYFHPDLRVVYRPRRSLAALARQYFEYGTFRRLITRRHPGSLQWRQVVAPLALVGNAAGVVVAVVWHPLGLVVPGAYGAAVLAASAVVGRRLPWAVRVRLPLVFATMHHAWAAGFLTSPSSLATARDAQPQ